VCYDLETPPNTEVVAASTWQKGALGRVGEMTGWAQLEGEISVSHVSNIFS